MGNIDSDSDDDDDDGTLGVAMGVSFGVLGGIGLLCGIIAIISKVKRTNARRAQAASVVEPRRNDNVV